MSKLLVWSGNHRKSSICNVRFRLIVLAIAASLSLPLAYIQPAEAGLFGGYRSRGGGRAGASEQGGGVRGNFCGNVKSDFPLLALLPDSFDQLKTLEAYPTFLVYMPIARSSSIETAELLLVDEQDIGTELPATTRIKFRLPDRPGLVSLKLPNSIKSLTVDRRYYWRLSIICDQVDTFLNPSVSGWIERVSPSPVLKTSLDRASENDKSAIFLKEQVWYDALATLTAQPVTSPAWKELLALFELSKSPAANAGIQTLTVVDLQTSQ